MHLNMTLRRLIKTVTTNVNVLQTTMIQFACGLRVRIFVLFSSLNNWQTLLSVLLYLAPNCIVDTCSGKKRVCSMTTICRWLGVLDRISNASSVNAAPWHRSIPLIRTHKCVCVCVHVCVCVLIMQFNGGLLGGASFMISVLLVGSSSMSFDRVMRRWWCVGNNPFDWQPDKKPALLFLSPADLSWAILYMEVCLMEACIYRWPVCTSVEHVSTCYRCMGLVGAWMAVLLIWIWRNDDIIKARQFYFTISRYIFFCGLYE